MDFGQSFEGEPPLIHTRIVTQPSFAREMVNLLQEALSGHNEPYECSRKPRPEPDSKG